MKKFRIVLLVCVFCLLTSALHARQVTDMLGRTVTVPDTITRVASPYRIATEMIFTLGEEQTLVGVSVLPGRVMETFYPQIKEVGIADRHANVEEILRLKPEVVFSTPLPIQAELEKAGIPVVCLCVEDPESMIRGLKLIGEVLGKQDRAREFGAYYAEKFSYIRTCTRDITPKKKVYVVGSRMLTTVGADFYQHHIIEAAGGINVAGELRGGWVNVNREHLVAWNPDVILTLPYSAQRPADIFADDGLSTVRAVKDRAVHPFPLYIDSWDLPTPESIMGIMWLANLLYPEQVHFDMEREAREFYTRFYGRYPYPVQVGGH